jgi:hypothetical protein
MHVAHRGKSAAAHGTLRLLAEVLLLLGALGLIVALLSMSGGSTPAEGPSSAASAVSTGG